jgi:hypothetical protein
MYCKILKNIEKILTSINIKCIENCSPNSTKYHRYIVEHIFSIFYYTIFQKGIQFYFELGTVES